MTAEGVTRRMRPLSSIMQVRGEPLRYPSLDLTMLNMTEVLPEPAGPTILTQNTFFAGSADGVDSIRPLLNRGTRCTSFRFYI
jgi:hypothetical protein